MIGGKCASLQLLVLAIVLACVSGCVSKPHAVAPPHSAAPGIIPRPNRAVSSEGSFELRPSTQIGVTGGEEARWTAHWLADLLRRTRKLNLRVGDARSLPSSDVILLEPGTLQSGSAPESYRLTVSPERIVVSANDAAGLFYGAVSVWQLASATVNDDDPISSIRPITPITIPALTIDDAPRFAWRGLMLDAARHYVPPAYVKKMIGWMALHKLNVLHWHLTDDQGWRLEIKKYPKLTSVGAWRVPAGAAAAADIDPATGKPRRYGGFYSQEQVRDIVAYAAARHVTIVPEIEMPGHATAAIAAYPELGVGGTAPPVSADWGIHNQLFNVEESTFGVLEDILSEVLALFPSTYIHVGGDEAVKDRWAASLRVQERMRELGVPNETALQSYFIERIERFLTAHGRRLIGWDEILEGGIAPEATVMSWRGTDGAIAAASQGHDAVLSPSPVLYFDHLQSRLAGEPPGRGGVVSLKDVYRFDPMPAALAADERQHILGVQGNLWSEHIRTEERLAYMAFPRAAALAEVAWTAPGRIDWPNFVKRLAAQFGRYRALGLPYASSAFDVRVSAELTGTGQRARVLLRNQSGSGTIGSGNIRYTVDGSAVGAASPLYTGAFELPADAVVTAATFLDGQQMSRTLRSTAGRMARRRYSQQLELCSHRVVLALEDDAPLHGKRSVFLTDIMNPCWIWRDANLAAATGLRVAVGQVPFNFQLGADRDKIELRKPQTAAGELVVRAGGCDGSPIAVLPLQKAAARFGVTVLSQALPERAGHTDLCFRFTADKLDPQWEIDWVELTREAAP